MTEHDGGTRCKYCYRPHSIGGHNAGCPVADPALMPEWQRGCDRGWNWSHDDCYLDWWQLQNYSPAFRLGYRAGKDEIDDLVDQAAQRAVWGDEY